MMLVQRQFVPNSARSGAIVCIAAMGLALVSAMPCQAQSGLRDSLERLDRNQNGEIEPDEITPLARPYLERIAKARRISLERPNRVEDWQEAARIYHAFANGVADERIRVEIGSTVQPFGPDEDEPMVPEFGLSTYKFPYTEDDLEEADDTLDGYDRNNDGFIDRRESRRIRWTSRDPFLEDLDGDDRLSRMELTQRYARRRLVSDDAGELIQRARRVGNGIRPSDARGTDDSSDGRNRWWERGSRYYLTAVVLGRFDANRNGKLESGEAAGLGFPAGRVDINRDGELSRDELDVYLVELQEQAGSSVEGLPTWFFERDANKDQQIAMAEFTDEWTDELVREFSALDTNDDGLLTSDEVISSAAMVGGDFRNTTAVVLPPRQSAVSEITVEEHFPIADLNVQVSVTHSHVAHLDIFLVSPSGARIELCTAVGGHDDHFDQTIFDDESQTPITKARPPFEGSFIPEGRLKGQPSLSSFNGKDIYGTWQLVVSGTRNDRFGMLNSWALFAKPMDNRPGMQTELAAQSEAMSSESPGDQDGVDGRGGQEQAEPQRPDYRRGR